MINWRVTFHSFFQRNTLETSVLVDNEWFINFSDFINFWPMYRKTHKIYSVTIP